MYILDQVRALERELQARLQAAGLEDVHPDIVVITRLIPEAHGTTWNERLESISGTNHARILRIPFRDREGRILKKWISRFDVWPYLERFTIDSTKEILAELGGKPQFVIGNYSGERKKVILPSFLPFEKYYSAAALLTFEIFYCKQPKTITTCSYFPPFFLPLQMAIL